MNNTRRKQIAEAQEHLEILRQMVEEIREDESTAFDNMPESLQYSEKGEAIEQALDNLDSVLQALEEAEEYLEEAKQ